LSNVTNFYDIVLPSEGVLRTRRRNIQKNLTAKSKKVSCLSVFIREPIRVRSAHMTAEGTMKTAIRHTSAFALVALLLSQSNPKVFAQGEGNSTVNCDAGGADCAGGDPATRAGADQRRCRSWDPRSRRHPVREQGRRSRSRGRRCSPRRSQPRTITNSTFRNNLHGIQTIESSGAFLQGNTFEANAVAGLAISHSSSAIVDTNTFLDNVVGLAVEPNASILLRHNTVTGNTSVGVLVRRNGFLETVNPANAFASNGTDVQCFERGIIDASNGPQQPGGGTVDADTSCLIIGTMY
jgi:parallel beta-helix repeat protein